MGLNVAANIEYEFVARPAGLQPEFVAPSDASLQFLAIKAIDGFGVDGALAQPVSKSPGNSTLVVSVHGSGQSYDKHPNACLLRLLPSKGIAVLAINTRQADARGQH
jgi:poly(3-hydroxybutyrate) depolymerase